MIKPKGIFILSLDFELYWGVLSSRTLESYRQNLLGVRSVVPRLLDAFNRYGIHSTWATVGFLFFETREDLLRGMPIKRPAYTSPKLSPYPHVGNIGPDESGDPFHYAPSLIRMISSRPHQEVGSHTFSHYYCLEDGQDVEAFRCDLEAAVKAARSYDLALESLVFPGNQVKGDYLAVCRELGFKAYRGNASWIYAGMRREDRLLLLKRGVRLADGYLNVSSRNCYSIDSIGHDLPFNICGSRLLRPYSRSLKVVEPLRLRRILSDLTYAARNGLVYHLYFHPHNFGVNLEENMSAFGRMLDHFSVLRETYGMESLNMGELAQRLANRWAVERRTL